MIPSPGESPGAWWANTGQATARRQDEREGRDPDAAFDVMTSFMHDVPPDIVAEAFARGAASPTPHSPSPGHWSSGGTPTRVLAGRHDRLFPLEFMRRLALERLNIVADAHRYRPSARLSRPGELVRRLETYRLHHGAPSVGRSRNLRSSAAPASGVQSSGGLGGTPGRRTTRTGSPTALRSLRTRDFCASLPLPLAGGADITTVRDMLGPCIGRRRRGHPRCAARFASVAGADPGDLGYKGPTFKGYSGNSGVPPSVSKPESKLWFNDGLWWAVMFETGSKTFHIFKLDTGTQTWTDTGTLVDGNGTVADALWDGSKLYIASHVYFEDGSATGSPSELYRYSTTPRQTRTRWARASLSRSTTRAPRRS